MGLKNHLEDGTGHILSLGLDLDYLHVEGAEQQASPSIGMGAENIAVLQVRGSALSNSSTSVGSSSSGCSTNSSYSSSSNSSDSEDERLQNVSSSASQNAHQDRPKQHYQVSSLVCHPDRLDMAPNQPSGDPPQSETSPLTDPVADCRTKVEFALKLGYPEELVLLVLRKLGPGALINDILGELVKLGTKTEVEQGPPPASQSSFTSLSSSLVCSSSSSNSRLDSYRLLCPSQLLDDKENLRPVVVDGSNVAMR